MDAGVTTGTMYSIRLGDKTDRLPTIIDHDALSLKVLAVAIQLPVQPERKHGTFDLRHLWRVR